MTEEFNYRSPFKYLWIGLVSLLLSFVFTLFLIKTNLVWVTLISGIIAFLGLFIGIGFLFWFLKKHNLGIIKLGIDYVEVPGRRNERVLLKFTEITSISEIEVSQPVIRIECKNGIHVIESYRMKKNDFLIIKKRLRNYKMAKYKGIYYN